MIRLALPNKGRLADAARELLERAGLESDRGAGERALQASLGPDFLALFVRAWDIPEFVADGAADLGITGCDLVAERGRPLDQLLDLQFGRCRVVVAGREDGAVRRIEDVRAGARVATPFPRIARNFFDGIGIPVEIVPVSGAAEIAPELGVADIIVDLVSTGSTLRMNGLAEIGKVMDSTAVLVARQGLLADESVRRRVMELVAAIESVLHAYGKRYLMANVPRAALDAVKRIIPGISGPTIVDVLDGGRFVAAHAVVDRRDIYRVIAELREIGAEGILVTKIERLMP
jgi:ATP phosphoribosyltransferase